MKNKFATTLLFILATLGATAAWCAGTPADIEKGQAQLLPTLQQAAAAAGGYKLTEIELKSSAGQLTISIFNSKLNSGKAIDREAEASSIVAEVADAIMGAFAFSKVAVIHVDYLRGTGNDGSAVQRIDFYKNPAGAFVIHKT